MIELKKACTYILLLLEDLARCFGPAILWMISALALNSLILSALSDSLYLTLLLSFIFYGVSLWLIYKGFKGLTPLSEKRIEARLEQDSRLTYRLFETLSSELVNTEDESARGLWHRGRKKYHQNFQKIRFPRPKIWVAGYDRYALRFLALGFLVISMTTGSWSLSGRILFPLAPDGGFIKRQHRIAAWIEPPAYTGQGRIPLNPDETIPVPVNSLLTVDFTKPLFTPNIKTDTESIDLKKKNDIVYEGKTTLKTQEKLIIRDGWLPVLKQNIKIIPDHPPIIHRFLSTETLDDGSLKTGLEVEDDYGLAELSIQIDLNAELDRLPYGAPYQERKRIRTQAGKSVEINPVFDLTAHSWAGLPVRVTLSVTDGAGQASQTQAIEITLPEKPFGNPYARTLIDLRKRLIWDGVNASKEVINGIDALTSDPDALDDMPPLSYLALRFGLARLLHSGQDQASVNSLIPLLWDVALSLENNGDLALAARDLRDVKKDLAEALADPNTSEEKKAMLSQELRQALANYFEALSKELAKKMQQNGQKPADISPEMLSRMVSPENLMQFLEDLEQDLLSGDTKSAEDRLSELDKMIDSLQSMQFGGMPQDLEFMMRGVNELQELIDQQENLLDRTRQLVARTPIERNFGVLTDDLLKTLPHFKALPPMPGSPNDSAKDRLNPEDPIDTSGQKEEQDALRYVLGELMRDADEKLGEIPEKMQLAEKEMRQSANAFEQNQPGSSIPHQELAIEYLKESLSEMSQKMAQRMQQMIGFGFGGMQQQDPLGRPAGQGQNGDQGSDQIEIPDENRRERLREILNTLRRRSGEYDRDPSELDYFRSLLDGLR